MHVLSPKPKPESEKSIQNKIRAYLASEGILHWKHTTDNRNLHTGLGIGCPDIVCVVSPSGRALYIEVKSLRRGSKPSENQLRFMAQVRKHGGVAGVARSVEEAMALVEEAQRPIG